MLLNIEFLQQEIVKTESNILDCETKLKEFMNVCPIKIR